MTETFSSFNAKISRLEQQLAGAPLKRHMDKLGKEAKKIAEKEASADLGGDPKFSGWKPTLDTRYDFVGEGVISFHPTRRAAGPWTVAEHGRHSAEGPRMVGPRLTKTGRVSRARQKRWNGSTKGKGTATRATTTIDRKVDQLTQEFVRAATRELLR